MPGSGLSFSAAPWLHPLWERYAELPRWKAALLAGLICWGISTFLYSPPFWLPLTGGTTPPSRVDDFIALSANPLTRDLHEPILAYRITTPLFAWLLGLRGFSGVILQYLAIPATLAAVYYAMAGRTTRRLALLSTLGLACTYTCIWTNTKPGFPDAVTHLAVAMLLISRHPFLILSATVLGTMNDERFVLSIPFLLMWHGNFDSFRALLQSTRTPILVFVAGLGIVFALRYSLTNGIIGPGIERPEVYDEFAGKTSSILQITPHDGWTQYWCNVLMSYRFLWIVFPLALLSMRHWTVRLLFTASVILVLAGAGFVADVSRSIGFAFPAFLLAVTAMSQRIVRPARLLAVAVGLCLVTPSFHVTVTQPDSALNIQLERPLPFSLIRAYSGWDVMDLVR